MKNSDKKSDFYYKRPQNYQTLLGGGLKWNMIYPSYTKYAAKILVPKVSVYQLKLWKKLHCQKSNWNCATKFLN